MLPEKDRPTKLTAALILERGSFEDKSPELAKEWNFKKNAPFKPSDYTPSSAKKVWWTCANGHESYSASLANRIRGKGCPKCGHQRTIAAQILAAVKRSGSIFDSRPELETEWDWAKNKGIDPQAIAPHSDVYAWWKCPVGHSWRTRAKYRASRGANCPHCSKSTSRLDVRALVELSVLFPDAKGREKVDGLEVDVLLPSHGIAIELDGRAFHADRVEQDKEKNRVLEKKGIVPVRVREKGLPSIGDYEVTIDNYANDTVWLGHLYSILATLINDEETRARLQKFASVPVLQAEEEYQRLVAYLPGPLPGESLSDLEPSLAAEWDHDANAPLTPSHVRRSTALTVSWRCPRGHSYRMTVNKRASSNRGCPYCSRQRLLPENSLAEQKPWTIPEWNTEKNNGLTAAEVAAESNRTFWWHCSAGHEWQTSPHSREAPGGKGSCRTCRSFGFNHPELMEYWDGENNPGTSPEEIPSGSGKKLWWKCPKGHRFKRLVRLMVKARQLCPICASIAIKHPEVVERWNTEANGTVKPTDLRPSSKKLIHLTCPSCGSNYQLKVYHACRLNARCPTCER